jgi:hypothetical protein
MEIEKLKKVESSEELGLEVQVSTVPPKTNGVRISSRRTRHEKNRNGKERCTTKWGEWQALEGEDQYA